MEKILFKAGYLLNLGMALILTANDEFKKIQKIY